MENCTTILIQPTQKTARLIRTLGNIFNTKSSLGNGEIEMNQSLKIGIIGDFDQNRPSQLKTDEAIDHVSADLRIAIDAVWLPTKSLEKTNRDLKAPRISMQSGQDRAIM